jgi:uncharacterized membrane protein
MDNQREERREEPMERRQGSSDLEAMHARARAEEEAEIASRERQMVKEQRLFTFKFTELIWFVFGVLEGLIGLRVLLKMMAANPSNAFATFIYGITEIFVLPFKGLTAEPSAEGFVLEIPAIIAMLVYLLVAWAIARAVWVLLYRPRNTV